MNTIEATVTEDAEFRVSSIIGKYNLNTDNVEFMLPQMLDGTVDLQMHRCGSHATAEVIQFTSDNRYSLNTVIITFCLSEEALRNAKQTLPFNTIGRKTFDLQLVFDISEALGLSRDRLTVKSIHAETGAVEMECIPSRSLADITCIDAKRSFHDLVHDYGSVLYDGIVTWAIDPMCPHGRMKFIDGIPHITGQCTDPTKFTKFECLRSGQCLGTGCDIYLTKEECQKPIHCTQLQMCLDTNQSLLRLWNLEALCMVQVL